MGSLSLLAAFRGTNRGALSLPSFLHGETEAEGRAVAGLRSRLSWCRAKAGVLSRLPVSSLRLLHLLAGARGSALGFGFPQKETPRQEFECKSLFGRRCAHWRAGENRSEEGSQGERVSEPVSVAACGCRELCPPGSLGSRWSSRPRASPPTGTAALTPLGLVKGRSWGARSHHPRSSTQRRAGTRGLELCELISRGWRAQAVSVRGGERCLPPSKGAEDTGDTLHPAV